MATLRCIRSGVKCKLHSFATNPQFSTKLLSQASKKRLRPQLASCNFLLSTNSPTLSHSSPSPYPHSPTLSLSSPSPYPHSFSSPSPPHSPIISSPASPHPHSHSPNPNSPSSPSPHSPISTPSSPHILSPFIISPTSPPCLDPGLALPCYQARRHSHTATRYGAPYVVAAPFCSLITNAHFSTTKMAPSEKLVDLKAKFTPPDDLPTKYTTNEVHRYMLDCMMAVGTPKANAEALADVLLAADSRGHFSHGLNRLEMYVNDVRQGVCAGGVTPTITKESVSTALVNGNNGLGPVVGNFCVDLAVKKAKETGIGWVCARGSNHYGIAGWYAMRATKEGMLGMSFTNTSPLVAPTRAKKPALGTNPLSLSAPAKNGDEFVLDMATCVVAVGKIEVERRKERPIPEGWAIDKDGQSTTNAAEGMSGALMPLGGSELHSGYKGYGLGMLVEIFCGLLSGGQYGPNVRKWMNTEREADLGQCFVAINPEFFAPGFEDRMSDMMDHCRGMEPADPEKPVLAAGDPERTHLAKIKKEGGITYHINQIKDSWKLAQALGVKPMQ